VQAPPKFVQNFDIGIPLGDKQHKERDKGSRSALDGLGAWKTLEGAEAAQEGQGAPLCRWGSGYAPIACIPPQGMVSSLYDQHQPLPVRDPGFDPA
jgi:hypothetical protein